MISPVNVKELYDYYVKKEEKFKDNMSKKDFIISYIEQLAKTLNEEELVANAVYAQMQHEEERGASVSTNYFNSIISGRWKTFRKNGMRYINIKDKK